VGDFDSDGRADLLQQFASTLVVWLAGAGGRLQARPAVALPFDVDDVAVADFDGDGRDDVAVSTRGEGMLRVLLAAGTGDLVAAESQFAFSGALWASDLDGDARIDLTLVRRYDSSAQTRPVATLQGLSAGRFGTPSEVAVGPLAPLATRMVDIDRDGRPDLIYDISKGYYSYASELVMGDGLGGFVQGPSVQTPGPLYDVGDFDGDGLVDLLTGRGGYVVTLGRNGPGCP
jgi:hypothetical protein